MSRVGTEFHHSIPLKTKELGLLLQTSFIELEVNDESAQELSVRSRIAGAGSAFC